jgi:hypothetical protein
MWKQTRGACVLLLAVMTYAAISVAPSKVNAAAGINQQMAFQGKVVLANGVNLANGTYNVEFKIYTGGTSGGGGVQQWSEDYLVGGTGGVTVTNGIFSVNLGAANSFGNNVNWNSDTLWLSLQVGNTSACSLTTTFQANCGGDGEMTPYIRLTAVPYAFNALQLGGIAATGYAQLAGTNTWSASNTFSGSVNANGGLGIAGLETQSYGSATNGSASTKTITNANSSATANVVNGLTINLVGTANANANANALVGLNFPTVAAATNNSFTGLNFGTGYSSLVSYNGTTIIGGNGVVQSAGIAGTYGNLTGVGTLIAGAIGSGFGTITTTNNIITSAAIQGATVTASGAIQGGSLSAGSGNFAVNNSGVITSSAGYNQASGAFTVAGASTFTGNITVNSGSASTIAVTSGASSPTVDQFSIDNTTSVGVTTAGVNGLNVHYKGGAAAVEAAGMRVDYTPGTASGGTWSGMRIVENLAASSGVASYGLKLEGGGSGAGTSYAVEVGTGWDIGLDVQSGGMQLANLPNEPATPTAGNLRIYAKDVAGRMLLKTKGPSGLDTPLQPALFVNSIAMLMPLTGATLTQWGMTSTVVGTASTPALATTNLHTAIKRTTVTSAAVANAAAEIRSPQTMVYRGASPDLGGFFFTCRFAVNTTVAGQRVFVGLTSSTAAIPTTQSPSSLTQMVGVGWDAGDATLQVMGNDGVGTATKTALSTSFPTNDTTAVYEAVFFSASGGSSIGYRISRIDTANTIASGSISAVGDLPTNTTLLAPHIYMNNGGTGAAVGIDMNRLYIESDN